MVQDKSGVLPWEVRSGLYTCTPRFALRREFPVSHHCDLPYPANCSVLTASNTANFTFLPKM